MSYGVIVGEATHVSFDDQVRLSVTIVTAGLDVQKMFLGLQLVPSTTILQRSRERETTSSFDRHQILFEVNIMMTLQIRSLNFVEFGPRF